MGLLVVLASRPTEVRYLAVGSSMPSLQYVQLRTAQTGYCLALSSTVFSDMEEEMVQTFPPEYLLNRVSGGFRETGSRFLLPEIKQRQLSPAVD